MQRTKQVAIILPDTLQSTGLQSLLIDYFHPVEVSYFPSFQYFKEGSDPFDLYFTNTETFVMYGTSFCPRQNENNCMTQELNALSITPYPLYVKASQELIIEQLQEIWSADNGILPPSEQGIDLSGREIDVLQLIVRGHTNKDIADKLNISLNTVLTHRKNITAKLGSKQFRSYFYAL